MCEVDVTFMEGYPRPEALCKAKEEQMRERKWMSSERHA